jgi:hypothetical protein
MIEITTVQKITNQDIVDQLITAFEGGSSYWAVEADHIPKDIEFKEKPWYADPTFWDRPDARIVITDGEDIDEDEKPKTHNIGLKDIKQGLELMSKNYFDTHWTAIVTENGDAITADVFLQLAVFGEVRYG